jgi:hypothetical protein
LETKRWGNYETGNLKKNLKQSTKDGAEFEIRWTFMIFANKWDISSGAICSSGGKL